MSKFYEAMSRVAKGEVSGVGRTAIGRIVNVRSLDSSKGVLVYDIMVNNVDGRNMVYRDVEAAEGASPSLGSSVAIVFDADSKTEPYIANRYNKSIWEKIMQMSGVKRKSTLRDADTAKSAVRKEETISKPSSVGIREECVVFAQLYNISNLGVFDHDFIGEV